MSDVGDSIAQLLDRAREFGEQREAKFQQVLDLLADLFGGEDDHDS